MLKLKKPLCVAMAALSIMGAAAVPTVSYLTSNSAGIIVSAEAATSNKSSFLENSRYNSKLKAYKVTYNTKYFDKEYCIWRSGNPIVNIKSSNTSVVSVYTRKNKNTGKSEYVFKTLKTGGSATITVKYKNNIDKSSTKTEQIKVNITGVSSNTAVNVGKGVDHCINSSGIESVTASNSKVKVIKFNKYIRIKGISTGNSRIRVIYNDGMIENLDCTVKAKLVETPTVESPDKKWQKYFDQGIIGISRNSNGKIMVNGLGVPVSFNYKIDSDYVYFEKSSQYPKGYISRADFARLCNCTAWEYGGNRDMFEKAKVVETIINICNQQGFTIKECIHSNNRFEGSPNYYDLTDFNYNVTKEVKDSVALYLTRPSLFNQGYNCFFGDGQYNYFWNNFNCWQAAWNGCWEMTYTRHNGSTFKIHSKQDYLDRFYGQNVLKPGNC